MLKHLSGTSYVCDNARELFVCVVGEHQLNSRIVARFKLGEVCVVRFAPHLRRAVVIANTSAKTNSRASKSKSERAFLARVPRFTCRADYSFYKEISGFLALDDIFRLIVCQRNVLNAVGL